MNKHDRRIHRSKKEKLKRRLANKREEREQPMFGGGPIQYEMSARSEAMHCGGIGAAQSIVATTGLAEAIDASLFLLEHHSPYHESDHVLNLAYNILAGGTCLDDLHILRANPAYLNGLGAKRIPAPSTAGDFIRRFGRAHVLLLMDTVNKVRTKLWLRQAKAFREEATLDVDGTITPTMGECLGGMDISHKGTWGYAPLIVSLANTREPLFIENRPGSAHSARKSTTFPLPSSPHWAPMMP